MFLEIALGGAVVYGLTRPKLAKALALPKPIALENFKIRYITPSIERLKLPKPESKPISLTEAPKPAPAWLGKVGNWLKTGETEPSSTNAKIAKHKVETQQFFLLSTASFVSSTLGLFGSLPLQLFGDLSLIYILIPICINGFKDLAHGKINLATLNLVVMVGLVVTDNFWVGNLILFIYASADKLILSATDTTQKELIEGFKFHPDFVWVVSEGVEVSRPFETLQVGDLVAVHAGEMIPIDGTVVKGRATVDQRRLTGEAQPVEREEGQWAFAATGVLAGHLRLRVERAGNDTIAAQISQILNNLNETTDFKSTVQMRSQDLADRTVLPTLILGALSLPVVGTDGAFGVLASHFKSRINLTAPLNALNYFKAASKQGILFKDGRSLDLLHGVDTLVFDKTGTLTQEEPELTRIHLFAPNYTPQTVLRYAASAEFNQTHPIAQAVLKAAQRQGLELLALDNASYKVGYGLQVVIEQQIIRVGSFSFMEVEELPISVEIRQQVAQCSQQAHRLILVAVDQTIVGGLELVAVLRPEARQVIQQLRQLPQIKFMYIISGDSETPTRQLAQELGIEHYFAETLPQKKAELIEQFQREGKSVCYIGDGINDSIALQEAQVSVSLRGASTVAMDTAQIVLMDGTLAQLPALFNIAQSFYNKLDLMFKVTLTPMIVGLTSVFLLNFGLVPIVFINKFGLVGTLWVARQSSWKPLPQMKAHLLPEGEKPTQLEVL